MYVCIYMALNEDGKLFYYPFLFQQKSSNPMPKEDMLKADMLLITMLILKAQKRGREMLI